MGHPIQVKGSDSQKNFDYVQVQKAKEQTQAAPNNASAKIYIGELHPKLLRDELEGFFSEVGPLLSCELSKDPVTGENPGYGYVTFQKSDDAKRALAQLHGFEMLGQRLQIGIVSDAGPEETGNPNSLSAKGKAALMSKLATGQQQPIHLALPVPSSSSGPFTSNCVAMRNMFDSSQQYGQDFQQDIVEDVAEECQSFGTVVHIAADMQEGAVYLKFASEESAIKAQSSLNKRAFNKRTITVEFVPPQEYFRKFNE
jgi:RNA-binding protein 39